jgi:RNA polymerase sigma factor (sigma-70 family)
MVKAERELLWKQHLEDNCDVSGKIILSYFPYIKKIAGTLMYKKLGYMEFEDIFQAGCIGVLKAIDSVRSVPTDVLIAKFIKNSIFNELYTQSRICHSSTYKWNKKILETQKKLGEQMGRNPTSAEIACCLGLKINIVRDSRLLLDNYKNISMDYEYDGNNYTLSEAIEGNRCFEPQEIFELNYTAEQISNAIYSLAPKQREFIKLYYYEDRDISYIAKKLDWKRKNAIVYKRYILRRLSSLLMSEKFGSIIIKSNRKLLTLRRDKGRK